MRIGRLCLTEPHTVDETSTGLSLQGREAWPTCLDRDEVSARHEDVLALPGSLVQVQFDQKCERNGYYTVAEASSQLTDLVRSGYADWRITLVRHGADTTVDLESRLTGAVRQNDHGLAGERWHAPAIGHYGYHSGPTLPSIMVRESEDGLITVYRGVPAGVSPRWGCAVEDYPRGRARVVAGFPGREVTGTRARLDVDTWALSNGLVRVRRMYTAGSVEVAAYTGGRWRPKVWQVDVGAGPVTSWESASILRNDMEAATVRLTQSLTPVGRIAVDFTLRRGSRFVEVYVQRGTSGAISVYLADPETMTNSGSYLVSSSDDADGNRATAGSARAFTPHPDGGLTRTNTVTLDCYLGVVAGGGGAVSGDTATALRDQYIGAIPESVAAVRR